MADHKFGKTGDFPRGKMNRDDEGALRMGVTHTNSEVVINFGTPVAWFGLEPYLAEQLANSILDHANKIRAKAQWNVC